MCTHTCARTRTRTHTHTHTQHTLVIHAVHHGHQSLQACHGLSLVALTHEVLAKPWNHALGIELEGRKEDGHVITSLQLVDVDSTVPHATAASSTTRLGDNLPCYMYVQYYRYMYMYVDIKEY